MRKVVTTALLLTTISSTVALAQGGPPGSPSWNDSWPGTAVGATDTTVTLPVQLPSGGVGAQEHPPGPVMPRWRRDAVGAQDLADGKGRHPVPEPAQLALDPDHAPPGVLPGQAHNQLGQVIGYRWAARRPGLAPLRRR